MFTCDNCYMYIALPKPRHDVLGVNNICDPFSASPSPACTEFPMIGSRVKYWGTIDIEFS